MKSINILAASALALAFAAPADAQVLLKGYDVDGDGELTGAELRDLFDADGITTLAAFDTDGDGNLSEAEYDAAFGAANVHWGSLGYAERSYTDWDLNSDGLVAADEYTQGFITVYDTDASGAIDGTEMQQMEADFGTDGVFGG